MEGLLVLLGAVVLAIPVALVYLLVSHSTLKRRVGALETKLAQARGVAPETAAQTVPGTALETIPADQPDPGEDTVSGPTDAVIAAVSPRAGPVITSDVPDLQGSAPTQPVADPPPKAVVLRSDLLVRLGRWLQENWFYAVSAVSLALAGIFLVQYGVEAGLLRPRARVLAALGFGAVLIVGGELIHRRYGDGPESTTAYLPSVFSGSGIVTLFGAVLSARLLYDLIGAEAALVGLVAVAVLAVVLGWFHGALLAAIGVIGAFVAPFVVGGTSEDPSWLYGYFGIVTLIGLAVDTIRRWAWVTMMTLVLAFAAGWLVYADEFGVSWAFMIFVTALSVLAVIVPGRRLVPDQDGTMIAEMIEKVGAAPWPAFPTRISAATLAAASGVLLVLSRGGAAEFWLAVACLTVLSVGFIVWTAGARALQDHALLPVLALLAAVADQANTYFGATAQFAIERPPGSAMPLDVTWLVGIGLLISVLAAWRARGPDTYGVVWAAGAALVAPAMAILIEISWQPAGVIGVYPWALHAAAIAAVMVVMAERFARSDGEDRLRTSFPVLSALSSIAFACVILFSETALTVALAVTVVAAAALDRRFRLPPMGLFISVGVVTLGYRLLADPGLSWAEAAPLVEILVAYGGTLAAFLASLWLIAPLERRRPEVMLDSAAWATGAILASLLLIRAIETLSGSSTVDSNWSLSLHAIIWLSVALAQIRRAGLGGWLAKLRTGLAVVFGLIGAGFLAASVVVANPLNYGVDPVLGLPVLNTLIIAYLLPALLLAAAAWRSAALTGVIRQGVIAVALALAALWLGLTVRHVWQGASGMAGWQVSQPELYSYTVLLLIIGAGLFYQSLAHGSNRMRKAGLGVIRLAVAKVFVIDISGLGGLTRVFSLLALGLSLAGLAWLNRWAHTRSAPTTGAPGAP